MSGATKNFPLVQARSSRSDSWAPAYFVESKCFGEGASNASAAMQCHANGSHSQRPSSSSSSRGDVWCFVVWKDRDRRLATWLPSANVDTDGSGRGGQVQEPLVSRIASTKISQSRRNAAPSLMAFLEDRLGRDMRSPNSIRYFHYAGFIFQPWYYAPYGLLYPDFAPDSHVLHDAFVCPFTLKVFPTQEQLYHETKQYTAARLSPPGREVYRDAQRGVTVLEVDGAGHRTFCRNMFLICKSFLENKLAGHDVDLYVFYVLCVHGKVHAPDYCSDDEAQLFAGFYSFEKDVDDYNLACIVTLPCFQGLGFGNFLISLSYENAYRRRTIGTPERPLSDLGAAAYERYWWVCVARFLHKMASQWGSVGETSSADERNQRQRPNASGSDEGLSTIETSVREIAKRVRLDEADVLETLLKKGLIHRTEKKELKVVVPVQLVKEVSEAYRQSKHVKFDPALLLR